VAQQVKPANLRRSCGQFSGPASPRRRLPWPAARTERRITQASRTVGSAGNPVMARLTQIERKLDAVLSRLWQRPG
jgi:hypothetical protein